MFAKTVKVIGKAALIVLACVGVLAVVIVWQLVGWLNAGGEPAKKKEPVPVVQVQSEKKEPGPVAAVVAECRCPGAVCVGSGGGRYCLDEGGKKRYLKNQP